MRLTVLKRLLVGAPMPIAQARHERLSKPVALAVFASDPLSSVAYATEEILLVLTLAGSVALSYSLPVATGIAVLLAIVVTSSQKCPASGRGIRHRRNCVSVGMAHPNRAARAASSRCSQSA